MSNYPYQHKVKGTIVIEIHNIRLRYKAWEGAELEVCEIPGEGIYFNLRIVPNEEKWPDLPEEYKYLSSASQVAIKLGYNISMFDSKSEAIQTAANLMEDILTKYEKIEIY